MRFVWLQISSLVLVLTSNHAFSQPSGQLLSLRDGLSQSVVRTMAEDSTGQLWIGTMDGLNCWDGLRFRVYRTTEIPNSFINSVVCTDSLVIVATGRGLAFIDSETGNVVIPLRFKQILTRLSSYQIFHLQIFRDSLYLSGTFGGIYTISLRTGSYHLKASTDQILRFYVLGSRTLFTTADQHSGIYNKQTATWERFSPMVTFNSFLALSDSSMLIGTQQAGLMVFSKSTGLLPFSNQTDLPKEPLLSLCRNREGNLFVSTTRSGIFQFKPSTEFRWTTWLPEPNAGFLFVSSSGEFFVGTAGRGLIRFPEKPLPSQLIRFKGFASQPHFWSLNGTRTTGVIASGQSGIFLLKNIPFYPDRIEINPDHVLMNGENVLRTIDDGKYLWILTRSLKLIRRSDDGTDLVIRDKVNDIFSGPDGQLTILMPGGQLFSSNDQQINDFRDFHDSTKALFRRVKNAGKGFYCFITGNSGLGVSHPETGRFWFGSMDSVTWKLTDNRVYDCLADSKNSLWIATNSGLTHWNFQTGKVRLFHTTDGLPSDLIYSLIPDHRGNIWAGTGNGLLRINPKEDKVDFLTYQVNGSTIPEDFMAAAGYADADGLLWMEGSSGLIRFHPDSMPVPFVSGNARFQVFSDDQYVPVSGEGSVVINSPPSQIRISITGRPLPDFWTITTTIQLKKDGQSLTENADIPLLLGSPGPGTYQIDYTMRYGGSNEFSSRKRIMLIINPFFWQTGWFLLSVLVVLFSLFFFIQFRINQNKTLQLLERQRVRMEEQEALRRQVAQDFHDELGHQLSKIALQSQLIATKLNKETTSTDVTTLVQKINDQSVNIYSNLRDLIWSLNPGKDTFRDLILRIKDTGDDFFYLTGVVFTTEGSLDGTELLYLSPEQKRHLLLIGKEAMTNSLRHSGCDQFLFRYSVTNDSLILGFSDNGNGFDLAITPGTGLSGIKNRMIRLGGSLDIQSDERGTSITISINGTT